MKVPIGGGCKELEYSPQLSLCPNVVILTSLATKRQNVRDDPSFEAFFPLVLEGERLDYEYFRFSFHEDNGLTTKLDTFYVSFGFSLKFQLIFPQRQRKPSGDFRGYI
jgi:hypothetical protein